MPVLPTKLEQTDHIIDALFGFSFSPPIRAPFDEVLDLIKLLGSKVSAVDIPSGWDVDLGPGENGYIPSILVSLTAPKPAAKFFKGRHFVGGRFIGKEFAKTWDFEIPDYQDDEQVVEVNNVKL